MSFNPYDIPTLAPTQPYRPRPDHFPPERQTQQQPPTAPSHSPRPTYQSYDMSTAAQNETALFNSLFPSVPQEQQNYGFAVPYDDSQQLYQQTPVLQQQQQHQSYVSYGPFNPAEHAAPSAELYKQPVQFSPTSTADSFTSSPRFTPATTDSSLKGFADMPPPPIPIRVTSQEKQIQRDVIEHGQKEPRELHSMMDNPIYGTYGSSALSLSTPSKHLKYPHSASVIPPPPTIVNPSDCFDPRKVGAPLPPAEPSNFAGVYSTSGLDLLGILSRVTARQNPEIELGPIDLGCSFTVTDPRQPDNPIIYASQTFSTLTGYSNEEVVGKNCRFLQSPDGVVEAGAKRAFTDGNAVHHLKRFISTGRESQASLINYRKGGEPFINLVTCIPIAWGDNQEEIAYYVGFQVNLVEMPTSIMNKMANGTYIVNYSLVGKSLPDSTHKLVDSMDVEEHWVHPVQDSVDLDTHPASLVETIGNAASSALVDSVQNGLHSLRDERMSEAFSKLLLEHCEDFVHVVSLKGTLLYVSPSVCKMLEYDPAELTGKTLASLCHPSDVVAVLRELKEASHGEEGVNLLYRVRRKHSGYIWLASHGKLFVEPGRSRKSIILSGRQEKVYNVSWADLERAGGLTDQEYWAKYSLDGMHLYSTPSVQDVLGYKSEELMGSTIAQLDESGALSAAIRQVAFAPTPVCTSLNHTLKGKFGPVNVTTNFYPSHAVTNDSMSTGVDPSKREKSNHIIAQTTKSSVMALRRDGMMPAFSRTTSTASGSATDSSGSSITATPVPMALPSYRERLSDEDKAGSSGSSSGKSSTSSFSAIPSTFKTLTTSASDNIFDELETTRGTSWQFELHQLKLVNRKLREEKAALATLIARKKKKRPSSTNPSLAGSDGASPIALTSKAKDDKSRTCANCGRGSTSEWRSGPTGPKTLCNACGLRWSKARSMSATSQSGGATSSTSTSMSSSSSSDQLPLYHSSDSKLQSPFSSQTSTHSSLSPHAMVPKPPQPMPHQQPHVQRPSLAATRGHYISYASSSGHSGDISSSGADSFGNSYP